MTPAPNRRWLRYSLNVLTILVVGPATAAIVLAIGSAFIEVHPLDRWSYFSITMAVGALAGCIVAFAYLIFAFAAISIDAVRRRQHTDAPSKQGMTPAPKRRWFRFSLRTLFIGVALIGAFLGIAWYFQPTEFPFEVVGDLSSSDVGEICAAVAGVTVNEHIEKIEVTTAEEVEVTSWKDRPGANGSVLGLVRRDGKWTVRAVTQLRLVEGKSRWEYPTDLPADLTFPTD